MKDIFATRLQNLRALLTQWGGPTSLSRKLKLSGPSYLSQVVGGNRPMTEKTARKWEQQLGLISGWFDVEHAGLVTPQIDTALITRCITLVGHPLDEAHLTVESEKFAEIANLVYQEAVRSGSIDETLVQRIVKLMR